MQIRNKGIDWSCESNVYWQHQVHRLEALEIILQGNAEFEASDVVLEVSGDCNLYHFQSSAVVLFTAVSVVALRILRVSFLQEPSYMLCAGFS